MKTNEKNGVKILKKDIKKLSEEQKFLKNQRKTDKIVGERKVEYWYAQSKLTSNRFKLRIMYAAYGLMRGKKFSVTENRYEEENHPLKQCLPLISKIMEDYSKVEKTKEKEVYHEI